MFFIQQFQVVRQNASKGPSIWCRWSDVRLIPVIPTKQLGQMSWVQGDLYSLVNDGVLRQNPGKIRIVKAKVREMDGSDDVPTSTWASFRLHCYMLIVQGVWGDVWLI